MAFFKRTPASTLSTAGFVALIVAAAIVMIALNQPWLGLTLQPDSEQNLVRITQVNKNGPAKTVPENSILVTIGDNDNLAVGLVTTDIMEEPDILPTYEDLAEFLARQDQFHKLLKAGVVSLHIKDNTGTLSTVNIEPTKRPLTGLPLVFWVQLFVGLASFLIGAWIYALRHKHMDAAFFALAGVGIFVFAGSAAIYSTRELALHADLFYLLSKLNHIGAGLFGMAMIMLFLTYPKKIIKPLYLLIVPLISIPWLLADAFQLVSAPAMGTQLLTLLQMLAILACIIIQYFISRKDPVARAAMRWFGLSVGIGAGTFVATIITPTLFGIPPILSQGYAFLFFLLIYVGLALGVSRYRLFDLDEWAFRILFYLGGAMLLILFDAILVFSLALDRMPAFSLSLLIVAFLYLPLRDMFARLFIKRGKLKEHELFLSIVDVGFAPLAQIRADEWKELMTRLFAPLEASYETAATSPTPEIKRDGLELTIPATADVPALNLRYPWDGKGLFGPSHETLVDRLSKLMSHLSESRENYDKGVAEERQRIARDMHDNIGAQLLSALHNQDHERKDTMIRESLSDLRDIINDASRPSLSFDEALAGLRAETAERLAAAEITLNWQIKTSNVPPLSSQTMHSLRSIIREAVSNIIKHADATEASIHITYQKGTISILIKDNGKGCNPADTSSGNGLANMQTRITSLRGTLAFPDEKKGLCLLISFPHHKAKEIS